MGIVDFLKKQFIEVIDWTESEDGVLAYRFPVKDREIKMGARLTVTDSQMALFVNEGKIADQFGPGLYTLQTQNLPILTDLKNWAKGFLSPFKADVYFFSTREQLNQKWGTPQPLTIRDKEFGPIRIRGFGAYSYVISDPKVFYAKISGTRELYTTQDLDGQLKSIILTSMASFFGGAEIPFVDMAANQQKFSDTLKEALSVPFSNYGLGLKTFRVESVSLPDEIQSYFDKKSQMSLLGDLGRYAQFQTADSIKTAAANSGGMAGAGVGIGVGAALGQAMAQNLSPQQVQQHASEDAAAQDVVAMLGKLHELVGKGVLTQAEFDAKKAELLKKIS